MSPFGSSHLSRTASEQSRHTRIRNFGMPVISRAVISEALSRQPNDFIDLATGRTTIPIAYLLGTSPPKWNALTRRCASAGRCSAAPTCSQRPSFAYHRTTRTPAGYSSKRPATKTARASAEPTAPFCHRPALHIRCTACKSSTADGERYLCGCLAAHGTYGGKFEASHAWVSPKHSCPGATP